MLAMCAYIEQALCILLVLLHNYVLIAQNDNAADNDEDCGQPVGVKAPIEDTATPLSLMSSRCMNIIILVSM